MINCVVLAGGQLSAENGLYRYAPDRPKALIPLEGRSMLEWVVNALQASDEIADLCIVGIPTADALSLSRPVHCLPDLGGIVPNAMAGLDFFRRREEAHVLFCMADVPLITGAGVSQFIKDCLPLDHAAYIAVHRRQEMEDRFPESRRSYFRLRDQELTASNIAIMHTTMADAGSGLWEALSNARKHPWQVARVIGFGTLIKFLFRRIGLAEAAQIGTRTFQKPVKILVSSDVDFGMDADKPYQLELIRAALHDRLTSATP